MVKILRKNNKEFHFVGDPLVEDPHLNSSNWTAADRSRLEQKLDEGKILLVKGVCYSKKDFRYWCIDLNNKFIASLDKLLRIRPNQLKVGSKSAQGSKNVTISRNRKAKISNGVKRETRELT